jgi:F-type H+-transporting ATPase subunit delta
MASTASSTYARALLEAARDAGDVSEVDSDLGALLQAIESDPSAWQLVTSPTLTAERKLETLQKALSGAHATTLSFMRLLVDYRRLELLPEIVHAFHELAQQSEGKLDVNVTTAIELSSDLRERLEERLSKSTGSEVRLHTSVDPSVIGGLVVQHGDTLVDASLRGRLEQLRYRMTHGTN